MQILLIQWTPHPEAATVQHMGVNLCGLYAFMPQQLLYGADIVTVFDKVGCKGMPQRMAACPFLDAASVHGLPHGVLHGFGRHVKTPDHAIFAVRRKLFVEGNTNCRIHSLSAFGYFLSSV